MLVFLTMNTPRLVLNLTEVIIYNGILLFCIIYFKSTHLKWLHIISIYFVFSASNLSISIYFCYPEHFVSGSQPIPKWSPKVIHLWQFQSFLHNRTMGPNNQLFYKKAPFQLLNKERSYFAMIFSYLIVYHPNHFVLVLILVVPSHKTTKLQLFTRTALYICPLKYFQKGIIYFLIIHLES